MTRKIITIISVLILITLGLLAWLIYQASPGPTSQDILGVTLGRSDNETGIVSLSGRRLDCSLEAEPPHASACTVTLAGKPLTIRAYRNDPARPTQLGGCETTYDGQTWPCQITSGQANSLWIAYIADPLGLNAAQMRALRQRYFFENLPEEFFLFGAMAIPFVVTFLVLVNVFIWQRPFKKRTWAITISLGLTIFIGTFFFALNLTSRFWD